MTKQVKTLDKKQPSRNKSLTVMVLYPARMSAYGDQGNLLALKHRAKLHGYDTKVVLHKPGAKFDEKVDIILGGGGQESDRSAVLDDLSKIGPKLKKLADSGTPMLVICGMYQLFGNYFLTQSGDKLTGVGIFDTYTEDNPKRLIGNIITKSDKLGLLIGYENHSGLTYFNQGQAALARVKKGAGNNGRDRTEGARTSNVFGSYLHGSILPMNPRLTDELIRLAAVKKYGEFSPNDRIDDSLTEKARRAAQKRSR
ncbi:glutamine amidotransferase [Candidatus Saccharibacteria bacterium]|nr:glutamine amidotransferase [Candidatus Saccharibacteria bacterium]